MKSWLVALGASVGLHVAAAAGVAWSPTEAPVAAPAPASRKTTVTIPVSVFSSPAAKPSPPGLSEPVEFKAPWGDDARGKHGPARRIAPPAKKEVIAEEASPAPESGLSEAVDDALRQPGLSEPSGNQPGVGSALTGASATAAGSPLTPTLSPLGGEGAPDVTAIVHARLAAVADRCYPAAARRFQQRGTVQLSFCTDERGAATKTAVTQSSGAELLDGAARGCVLEAASPFPAETASRCFSVPVRFGVR